MVAIKSPREPTAERRRWTDDEIRAEIKRVEELEPKNDYWAGYGEALEWVLKPVVVISGKERQRKALEPARKTKGSRRRVGGRR
jgi:hypothetical protein